MSQFLQKSWPCLVLALAFETPTGAQEFKGRIELEAVRHKLSADGWKQLDDPSGFALRFEWGEPTNWMHTVFGVQRVSGSGDACPDTGAPCEERENFEVSWQEYSFGTVFRLTRGRLSPSLGTGVAYIDTRIEWTATFTGEIRRFDYSDTVAYAEVGLDLRVARSWDVGIRYRRRFGVDKRFGIDGELDSRELGLFAGLRW